MNERLFMKKMLYMLLLLVESFLMAGTTPPGSPQQSPRDSSFDEADQKQMHALDLKQPHISNPCNTPLVGGTPVAPFRMLTLVRSHSDSCLVYQRPSLDAGKFIATFGPAAAFVLAHEIQKQKLQPQESKAE
jgi:hypothetical protein